MSRYTLLCSIMVYSTTGKALGLKIETTCSQDLIKLARNGLLKQAIDSLAQMLKLSPKDLTPYIHISERTLQRYEDDTVLSPEISDRLIQIAKVYAKAVDVFEDEDIAVEWLKNPSQALGNITPISCLDSLSGIELITDELGRIEYGVFS